MILWNNENDLFEFVKPPSKRGCVFPIVIWAAFRMGQYRVNDHPYHAPQFIESLFYGDIEGSTCYSGEQKALAFRANGSYNCRLRRHKRMESRRNLTH